MPPQVTAAIDSAKAVLADQDPKIVAVAAAGAVLLAVVGLFSLVSMFGGGDKTAPETAVPSSLPFVEQTTTIDEGADELLPLDSRFCHNPQPARAAAVDPTGPNLVATFQRIGTAPWQDETEAVGLFNRAFYERTSEFYGLPAIEATVPAFVACLDTVGLSESELRCTGYKTGQDHLIWGYRTTLSFYAARTGELVLTREYAQVANECPTSVEAGTQGSVQRIATAPMIRDLAAYVVPHGKNLLQTVTGGREGEPSWCDQPTRRAARATGDGAVHVLLSDNAGLPGELRDRLRTTMGATHVLCVDWTRSADRVELRCDYSRTNSVSLAVGDYHLKLVSLESGQVVRAAYFPANRETCPDPKTAEFGTPFRMEANDEVMAWMDGVLATLARQG